MIKKLIFLLLITFSVLFVNAQVKIGLLKYNGGGDWYANPTSLPELVKFCNQSVSTSIDTEILTIDVGSNDLFKVPFVHMTGHGNVVFSDYEAENLRTYLLSGGFLHIDDNYGMDKYIRRELKKVFPQKELIELPFDFPIYHQTYSFPKGLPKVHEHDNGAPQGFGIFHEGRLVLFYTFECDLGDGWEEASVHKDSKETRTKALKMGANIIEYVFEN